MSEAEELLDAITRLEALVQAHRSNGEHEQALACSIRLLKLLGILDEPHAHEPWLKSIALAAN